MVKNNPNTRMKSPNDLMKLLFDNLAEELLSRLQSGEASSSDLNIIRQFLKDNGIEAPKENPGLSAITSNLPVFDDDEDSSTISNEMH